MSKKRRDKLLSDLYAFYLQFGPRHYVDANTLPGYEHGDKNDFAYTLNQLIEENLILFITSPDKRPAITINPAKVENIRSELNVWYSDRRFIISTSLGVAGWLVAIISLST